MTSWKHYMALLAIPLAACQTTPPHHEGLREARQAYASASLHPQSGEGGGMELRRARQSLDAAERAWADRRNDDETRHLAYLAYRQAQAAHLAAEQRHQEAQLKQASVERERIRGQGHALDAQAAHNRADRLSDRADQLSLALQQMQARNTDRGLVVTVRDVLFDTAQDRLHPGARRSAAQLADILKQHPQRRIRVEGFADSRGDEGYNQALSQRRAESFRDALVEHGVPADRIDVQGLGEAFPVATNATAAGRQQNRRIEVVFSDEQGQVKPRP